MPIPTYEDFLKGAGLPYANSYSDQTINAQYDPYFNFQLGAEDYQKGLAQNQLGVDTTRLTNATNQNFSDRGIFGSSIYNDSLNQSLGDLNQGFQQQYGSSQYTPYNQRRESILQNQVASKAQAKLSRQGQAFGAYQQTYYPTLYNAKQ